jgi:hypothetical protein
MLELAEYAAKPATSTTDKAARLIFVRELIIICPYETVGCLEHVETQNVFLLRLGVNAQKRRSNRQTERAAP